MQGACVCLGPFTPQYVCEIPHVVTCRGSLSFSHFYLVFRWMNAPFFICSTVAGHLGLMQCLTIMGESSVHVLCPLHTCARFWWACTQRELPGLEKTGVQFYLETAVQRVCACPNYCQQCKATVGLFYKF